MYSWKPFWFVSDIPEYMKFVTFSKPFSFLDLSCFLSIEFQTSFLTSNYRNMCLCFSLEFVGFCLINHQQHRPEANKSHSVSVFLTFLMAYSKAVFRSSDNEAIPCYTPFWTGKVSNVCLFHGGFHFKHILIKLTGFMGVPNTLLLPHRRTFTNFPMLKWRFQKHSNVHEILTVYFLGNSFFFFLPHQVSPFSVC